MKEYASGLFHFDRESSTFTVDVSTLGGTAAAMARGWQIDGQVYNDAADSGFAIRSKKTGKLAIYTLKETDTKEGEIRAWEYAPAQWHPSMFCNRSEVAGYETYKHTTVTIFND